MPSRPYVQTIEKTGKDVKFSMLMAGFVFLAGIVVLGAGYRVAGGLMATAGGIGYFVAKAAGWWKHG